MPSSRSPSASIGISATSKDEPSKGSPQPDADKMPILRISDGRYPEVKGYFLHFSHFLTRSPDISNSCLRSGLKKTTRDSLIQSHLSTLSSRLVPFDTKGLAHNSLSGSPSVSAGPSATGKGKLTKGSHQPDEESVISISDEDDSVLTVYGIFFLTHLLHNIH
jgi:hypothetical protein